MNRFLTDAVYNFKRAAGLLCQRKTRETIEDATMQFAFGAERVFKGILVDINPVFILESNSFENALSVLYRDKLIPAEKDKADKEASKGKGLSDRVLPFQGSMFRASKFSPTTAGNIGVLTQLSDYRGIVAHRTLDALPYEAVEQFLLRLFHPLVAAYAAELGLPLDECSDGKAHELKTFSDKIIKQEAFAESFEELLAKHREEWETRPEDSDYVKAKAKQTDSEITKDSRTTYDFVVEDTCPACDNSALLFIETDWDVEYSRGEAFPRGIFVAGLECRFCGLELHEYEQFDYLNLNERLTNRQVRTTKL